MTYDDTPAPQERQPLRALAPFAMWDRLNALQQTCLLHVGA